MKKIALLLSLGLLAACGGSGGGVSSNSGAPSEYVANGPTGTLAINIKEPTSKIGPSAGVTSTATWRRIIVTNPAILNTDGKMVQFTLAGGDYDTSLDTPSLTIAYIPVATGYTVELIEYEKTKTVFESYSRAVLTGTTNPKFNGYSISSYRTVAGSTTIKTPINIKKYFGKTFNMTGSSTSVTLEPAAISASVTQPVLFHGGIPSAANISYNNLSTLYKLKADLPTLTPFNTTMWTLKQGYAPTALTSTTIAYGSTTQNLVGPSAYNSNNDYQANYYSAATFNLSNRLLLGTEKSTDFAWTSDTLNSLLFTKTGSLN